MMSDNTDYLTELEHSLEDSGDRWIAVSPNLLKKAIAEIKKSRSSTGLMAERIQHGVDMRMVADALNEKISKLRELNQAVERYRSAFRTDSESDITRMARRHMFALSIERSYDE